MKFSTASTTAFLASLLLKAPRTTTAIGPFQVKTIRDGENLRTDILSTDLDPFAGTFYIQRNADRGNVDPQVTVFGMINVDDPTGCEDGEEISMTNTPIVFSDCNDDDVDADGVCRAFTLNLDSTNHDYSYLREVSGSNSETLDLCFRVSYNDPTNLGELIAPIEFRSEVTFIYEGANFDSVGGIAVTSPAFEEASEDQTSTLIAEAYLCNESSGTTVEPGQEFSVCVELDDNAPVEFEASAFKTLNCANIDLITEDVIAFPSITTVDESSDPISFSQVLTAGMLDAAAEDATIECTGVVNVAYKYYYIRKSGFCPVDGYLSGAEECEEAISILGVDSGADMNVYGDDETPANSYTPGCHYRAQGGDGPFEGFADYSYGYSKPCDEEVPCICRGNPDSYSIVTTGQCPTGTRIWDEDECYDALFNLLPETAFTRTITDADHEGETNLSKVTPGCGYESASLNGNDPRRFFTNHDWTKECDSDYPCVCRTEPYSYYVRTSGTCPLEDRLSDDNDWGECDAALSFLGVDIESWETTTDTTSQDMNPGEVIGGCGYEEASLTGLNINGNEDPLRFTTSYDSWTNECSSPWPCICRGEDPDARRRQLQDTSTRALQTATETGDFSLTLQISSAPASSAWFASTIMAAVFVAVAATV